MKQFICWGAILFFLIGCVETVNQPTPTPIEVTSDPIYFGATGHSVQAPFSRYYLQQNGAERLGMPITEALDHEGWRVQYFQYGRLEAHPENSPDYFITIGWLGQLSHRTQPPIPASAVETGLYFPETGHTISGDFLSHFLQNGNTVKFGQPISQPFLHRGKLVQDFQSARFIWYPSLPVPSRVQLEPLGETYFLQSDLPSTLLKPISVPAISDLYSIPMNTPSENADVTLTLEPTSRPDIIRVRATFFENELPIQSATATLTWAQQSISLPPSRSDGHTHLLIDVSVLTHTQFTLLNSETGQVLANQIYRR